MNPTSTQRRARLAALALCPVAVMTSAPAWAATSPDPADSAVARAGTGALVSKSLSARTTLTSTSGKKLALTVNATGTSSGSTVMVGLAQGNESHLWSFKARAADLQIGSTGAGTLTLSSTQTGQRGRLNLKFSPTDTVRKQTCGGQVASRTRPMAVSGIAHFKTGTASWGTVGSTTRTIAFSSNERVTWSYDVTCSTPPPVCTRVISWSAFHSTASTTQGVSGSSNGTTASVTAYRSTTLTAPAGASRTDLVTVRSAALPTFSTAGSSATLTARSGGGSLTVQGDGAYGSSSPCRSGTTTTTSTQTSWFGSATNGSPAFKVPAQVFGAFSVPTGATASISRQTF